MSRLVSAIVAFLFSVTLFAETARKEVMTNQSIFDMMTAGKTNAEIVQKIENSETDFEITVDKIPTLKKKGVSQEILLRMFYKQYKDPYKDLEIPEKK
jgi:hypothetical protein